MASLTIRDNMANQKYTKAREIALVIWLIAGAILSVITYRACGN